ncbi:hypothetical protein ACFVWG_24480 [Kribbella sp. NPDC058245]|uniref:hypothetical protein n=1 Tax=Kribbella sp. NPDC058245 TaxID=3346399 RepID=UPI0036E59664
MTDDDGNESILGQVQPYEWDDQQAISFEVAQDTISLFIAHCTDRIWIERRKDAPDESVIEHWLGERRAAVKDSEALRSDDPGAIRGSLETYGRRVRERNGDADG